MDIKREPYQREFRRQYQEALDRLKEAKERSEREEDEDHQRLNFSMQTGFVYHRTPNWFRIASDRAPEKSMYRIIGDLHAASPPVPGNQNPVGGTMSSKSGYVKNVETAMAEAGMPTWYALAKAAGIKVNTMYRYRSGKIVPGMAAAIKIARALGTPVEKLNKENREGEE